MLAPGVYIVEVLGHSEDLMYTMEEINQWVDDKHVYVPRIQFYWNSETLILLAAFNACRDATSFARFFDGQLLDARTSAPPTAD